MTNQKRKEEQEKWNLENHEFVDLIRLLINKLIEINQRSGSKEMPYIIEAAKQMENPYGPFIKTFGTKSGLLVEDFFKTMDFVANSKTIDIKAVLAAGEYIKNSEGNLAKAKMLIEETKGEILKLMYM
jgi:hypothetical protein